jgi:Zn-dependent protease with chaperone function
MIEAVLFHEIVHLKYNHLLKRWRALFKTYVASIVGLSLVSLVLSRFNVDFLTPTFYGISCILPLAFALKTNRSITQSQELEADRLAVSHYGATPEILIHVLKTLGSKHEDYRIHALSLLRSPTPQKNAA